MKTEKAKFLNAYIMTAIKVFNDGSLHNLLPEYKIKGHPVHFNDEDFENQYRYFLEELQDIVIETKDIDVVCEYVITCLKEVTDWNGFTANQFRQVFVKGHEISFLINLKRNIDKYAGIISNLAHRDKYGDINDDLIEFYEGVMTGCRLGEETAVNRLIMKEDVETFDDHLIPDMDKFDLFAIKVKSDLLPDTLSRINYINGLLSDFKQLQLKSKRFSFFRDILSRSRNFEKFCNIELERLHNQLETEYNNPPGSEPFTISKTHLNHKSSYVWKGSDADMIELATALYKAEAIKRNDGKPITLKEIVNLFEQMFNYKVKETSFSHMNDRGHGGSMTPFLDSLMVAFEAYCLEQDENRTRYN